MSKIELRQLAASSALEIERACLLYGLLKEIVDIEGSRPDLFPTPILPLLAHATDGVLRLFEECGIVLRSTVPGSCQPVMIDKARTLQVLSTVLLVAHGASSAGDVVEVIASADSPDAFQVVIRNLTSHADKIDAERSLSMALADAAIRSQRGKFSWSLRPFNVQFELQRA